MCECRETINKMEERIETLERELTKVKLRLTAHAETIGISECECGESELYCCGSRLCYRHTCRVCAIKEGWDIDSKFCSDCKKMYG